MSEFAPGALLYQGQAATAAAAITATIPIEVTKIVVCNTNTSHKRDFTLHHDAEQSGATTTNALFYETEVPISTTQIYDIGTPGNGIQLGVGDVLWVNASTTDIVFSIYGVTRMGR